ncbi:MAG: TatD family hydrolase [Clostridia bacterium]|nr:TatD family hydrolase [Clostridia bacterium]
MRFFDSHVHPAFQIFDPDFPQIVSKMKEIGITDAVAICDPGDEEPDHEKAIGLVRQYPLFRLAIACHPQNAYNFTDETEAVIRRYAALPECTSIGETGLDYFDNRTPKDVQKAIFERHLDIACDYDMPVQLHIRNAHGDAIDILRARYRQGRLPRGILHCFTRSWELEKVYLDLGFYVAFGGVITFKNANKVLEAVQKTPVDRLVLETDSPHMAPEPMTGQRNEPAFLKYIFDKCVELRNADPEALAEQIWLNTDRATR